MSVDVGPGRSVFASWGKSFRAPAVIENACADPEAPCPLPFALGDDPPLEPVKASTFEAASATPPASFVLEGSVYHMDVRDDIFLTPFGGGRAGGQHHRRLLREPRQDPARRRGARRRLSLPKGALALPQLLLHPGHFESPAEIFSIRSTEDAGTARRGHQSVPDRERGRAGRPVSAGRRTTCSKVGGLAARSGEYLYVGADGALHRQAVAPRATRPTSPSSWTATSWPTPGWAWSSAGGRSAASSPTVFQNRYASFGTFNINQGNPAGPTVERFLTPARERMFRLIVRTSLGGARQEGGVPDID